MPALDPAIEAQLEALAKHTPELAIGATALDAALARLGDTPQAGTALEQAQGLASGALESLSSLDAVESLTPAQVEAVEMAGMWLNETAAEIGEGSLALSTKDALQAQAQIIAGLLAALPVPSAPPPGASDLDIARSLAEQQDVSWQAETLRAVAQCLSSALLVSELTLPPAPSVTVVDDGLAVLNRRLSSHPALAALWDSAVAAGRDMKTPSNMAEGRRLYENTRERFIHRLLADTPEAASARSVFERGGFGFENPDGSRVDGMPLLKQAANIEAAAVGKYARVLQVTFQHVDMISKQPERALDGDNIVFMLAHDHAAMDSRADRARAIRELTVRDQRAKGNF